MGIQIGKLQKTHLEETNLDYWEHLRYGLGHTIKSCYVVWTSFWHALYPEWYPYVAEGVLIEQYKSLKKRMADRDKFHKENS